MQHFHSRKAYIYCLETWAQIAAAFVCGPLLGDSYLTFVDNEASKHALIKGYGKDEHLNCLIGTYWSHCTDVHQAPWMLRVSSAANISDKVSRFDFTTAKERRWLHLDFDFEHLYKLAAAATTDLVRAHVVSPAAFRCEVHRLALAQNLPDYRFGESTTA
jgi:hypothetical protein